MKKMESRLSKLIICSLFSAFFTVIPPVVITKFQPAFANPGGISSAPLLWLDATDIDSNTATSNPATNATIPTWVDLLAATGVVDSKSAARRIVKEGGAYLNNTKISGEDFAPEKSDFLCGKYAVLRKGKRDLAAVVLI